MNPMENVWAVLKANVSNYKPRSAQHLIKIIKKEWRKLDGVFAENLVLSMKIEYLLFYLMKVIIYYINYFVIYVLFIILFILYYMY